MVNILLIISIIATVDFNGWDTLSKLTITNQYDEMLGDNLEIPVFSVELKEFDNQIITIEGYVIPIQQTEKQDYFVLSRFPYNSCFFCGNAGPETVAEVYTLEKVPFKDERVTVTGTLKLNADDPLHLFYIIENAKVERVK